jgi:hypothetical protein
VSNYRAYRLAKMPKPKLPDVGSFDQWTRRVRDLVYWLTGYDVGQSFQQNKLGDPARQADTLLLEALHNRFMWRGNGMFSAADVIEVYKAATAPTTSNSSAFGEAAIDALLAQAAEQSRQCAATTTLQSKMELFEKAIETLRQVGEVAATRSLVEATNLLSEKPTPKWFGAWARRRTGAYTGDFILQVHPDPKNGHKFWVEKI